jgi:hypothetical protein
MPFEKVERGSQAGGQAKISMRQSGSIGINSVALSEYFEDTEYAEVYWDEENQKLGIHATGEETDSSFKISRSGSGGSITPSSFLKTNNLIPETTIQYTPSVKEHDGMELVVVDLSEEGIEYGSGSDED